MFMMFLFLFMCVACNRLRQSALVVVASSLLAAMPAHGAKFFVDSSVDQSGDGTTGWSEALKTLQEALDVTAADDEIWVAVGNGPYLPTEGEDLGGAPLAIRTRTFTLQSQVGIYGGFSGDEENRTDRNPEAYDTVLSGVFAEPSGCPDPDCFEDGACVCQECRAIVCDPETGIELCCLVGWTGQCAQAAYDLCPVAYNAYHVVTASSDATVLSARLDGFTVTGGLADGNGYVDNGYAKPDETCGGGIFIDGHSITQNQSGPAIVRSRLSANGAVFGGGLASDGASGSNVSPILVNLELRNNAAASKGPDEPLEPGIGGGAWSGPSSCPQWVNGLFAGNTADDRGGALFMKSGSEGGVVNCTFADNDADDGAGIYLEDERQVPIPTLIANCILYGNEDSAGFTTSSQLHVVQGADVTVRHCDVQDYEDSGDIPNVTDEGGNIGDEPDFTDPPDDYRLDETSPCIDTGCGTVLSADVADVNDDSNLSEPLPWDLDTNPRVLLGGGSTATIVDMGAYEFAGTGCRWDCQQVADGTAGINDFLELLAEWGQECVPCDFGLGPDGVGVEEFLSLLANWGSCPDYTGSQPDSIEDVVTDAGLEYPDDWDEFVDVMTDSEQSQATKDNYRCWMDHYLDCHRMIFCVECSCKICPDSDPFGGH